MCALAGVGTPCVDRDDVPLDTTRTDTAALVATRGCKGVDPHGHATSASCAQCFQSCCAAQLQCNGHKCLDFS